MCGWLEYAFAMHGSSRDTDMPSFLPQAAVVAVDEDALTDAVLQVRVKAYVLTSRPYVH